jgi:hypothetical protein
MGTRTALKPTAAEAGQQQQQERQQQCQNAAAQGYQEREYNQHSQYTHARGTQTRSTAGGEGMHTPHAYTTARQYLPASHTVTIPEHL